MIGRDLASRRIPGTVKGRYSLLEACLALTVLFACLGAGAQTSTAKLRTITKSHDAHSLTIAEAKRAYPVHLRGVVTYDDPYVDPRHIALFIHDSTGSIFVSVPSGSFGTVSAGTIVDVQGVSGTGDFAPIIARPHMFIVGESHLPANPPRVSLTRLLSGAEDGQWVEVEGVIRSVFETEHNVTLQLAMTDGTISATTLKEPGVRYSSLIDARVRIHANAAPLFNDHFQMIGARILTPNLSAIQIVEPAPDNPFALATHPISSLLQFNPAASLPHRVHLRGIVTLQWPGSALCIRDATAGLCAQIDQDTRLAIGDVADVAGFPVSIEGVPALTDAVFAKSGVDRNVAAEAVTAEQVLLGKYDSELVQIDGQLIGRDLAASDTTLMLASGKFIFAAVLPKSLEGPGGGTWKNGSRLRVTGICSVQVDTQRSARRSGGAERRSFRILLRSPQDVVVIQRASWWTPRHALLILSLILSITLVVLGWVVVLRKRVEQQTKMIRHSEEQFRYMALHDALTGLPMRVLLHDRLNSEMERSKRYGTDLALLMLDLDSFKLINDSLGHDAGDETLRVTARRIVSAVRKSDTVARMGGDEFVVLLTDLTDPYEAERIAAKIVSALSVSICIGNREIPVSVSVGICIASGAELNADSLLKRVDTAMYHAKAQGRNCFQVFTADMARDTVEKLRLQIGLDRALELKELLLQYQPMVSFETGEVTGFEALLRWRSKELGLVMPGEFIPLAEQSGAIVPIGEWVLREACRQIGILERQLNRTFLLSVNLSPRQFQQHDLPQMIECALKDYERAPGSIEFEITEGMLMSDTSRTRDALKQLRDLGVQLAIDDFGIGFSSLSYIARFTINCIKIDRSFIEKCTTDESSLAIIRAVVTLAHGLGIRVVAEGVELIEQFRFLQRERCDTAQGYYFSRPVPASELPNLLLSLESTALGNFRMGGTRRIRSIRA